MLVQFHHVYLINLIMSAVFIFAQPLNILNIGGVKCVTLFRKNSAKFSYLKVEFYCEKVRILFVMIHSCFLLQAYAHKFPMGITPRVVTDALLEYVAEQSGGARR